MHNKLETQLLIPEDAGVRLPADHAKVIDERFGEVFHPKLRRISGAVHSFG